MTSAQLIQDLMRMVDNADEQPTTQWLRDAQRVAPSCVLPALLYLKRHGVKGHDDLLASLAISFPDRRELALQLGEDAAALSDFYPQESQPPTPDTMTTIDRFLDNYGSSSPAEVEAISRAIFNPMPDYADVLAAQEQQEGGANMEGGDAQDELINQFIAESMHLGEQAAATPVMQPVGEQEKAEIADSTIGTATVNDESMLSESLAKMYISRHKYSQALEIIKGLSLKYPEKSCYFADQIRFLSKLVLNETLNDKK